MVRSRRVVVDRSGGPGGWLCAAQVSPSSCRVLSLLSPLVAVSPPRSSSGSSKLSVPCGTARLLGLVGCLGRPSVGMALGLGRRLDADRMAD